jgi:hypothetical protein
MADLQAASTNPFVPKMSVVPQAACRVPSQTTGKIDLSYWPPRIPQLLERISGSINESEVRANLYGPSEIDGGRAGRE